MIFKILKENLNYLKNVGNLSLGTIFAGIIPILFYPIFTRLYSPEDLGAFQIFFSLGSYFVLVSSFRFELAFFQINNVFKRIKLLSLCFYLNILVSLFALIFTIVSYNIENKLYITLGNLIFMLPIFSLAGGFMLLSSQISISLKKFKVFVKAKIFQNSSLILQQFFFGISSFKLFGLIISDINSRFFFTISTIPKKNYKLLFLSVKNFSFYDFKKYFNEYKNFAIINIPSKLINLSAINLPIILIGLKYDPKFVGFYFLIDRIFAPLNIFISEALSNVLSSELNTNTNSKLKIKRNFFTNLFISTLTIIPYIIIIPFIEDFIDLVFGSNWNEASKFYIILLPMFVFGIISTTFNNVLAILNKLKTQLILDIARTSVLLAVTLYCTSNDVPVYNFFIIFSITAALFYISTIYLSYYFIDRL